MMAAQLWETVLRLRPDIEADFAAGQFGWLLAWLRREVHARGRRTDALTLMREVTGEELSARRSCAIFGAVTGPFIFDRRHPCPSRRIRWPGRFG